MDNCEYRYLSLCDGYVDNKELWFSNCTFNALCKLNLDSFNTEIVSVFERRPKWQRTLHRKIIEHNNFFYFIPNSGTEIDIINRETGIQSYIKIPRRYLQNGKLDIADAIKENGHIWMFPVSAQQSVIVYDIDRHCFYEEHELTSKLREFGGTVFTYKSAYLDGDYLWLVVFRTNCVISFDLKRKRIQEYRLDMDNLYSINNKEGEEFWLGTWNTGSIAIWNCRSNKIKYIVQNLKELYFNTFFNPIIIGNKICVLSKEEGKYWIGEDKKLVRIVPDTEGKGSGDLPYIFYCIYNHEMLMLPYKMKYIIRFNLVTETVNLVALKLSESFVIDNFYDDYKMPFLKNEMKKELINETYEISIGELINMIDIKSEKDCKKINFEFGEIIWNSLRRIN